MNRNILYIIFAISLLASCRKDDDNVFDKSPDERLNETLAKYQAALTSSTTGWNANLVTGDGGSYRFYFSFDDKNRVQMYSDFDTSTSSNVRESSYRLKALQQPSLIFDTYSYIHMLSDPDGSVNGGNYGQGLKSDFEFAIDTVTADSVLLTGRYNGSKLKLVKAAAGDRAVWSNKQVTNAVLNFRSFWKIDLYWKRLTYGGTQYELQFDSTIRSVKISWGSGSTRQSVTRQYYFWANGIFFSAPLVNGSVSIPGFSITGFNTGTQVLNVTVNGTAATIAGATTPLNPDVTTAAERWWQQSASGSDYWISFDGWHSNGVDDAYNIKALKNDTASFYFILYKANASGQDAFFNIFLDSADNELVLMNGSWVKKNKVGNAGLNNFTEISQHANAKASWPATGAAALTRSQMYNTSGYYFVQSSSYTYDQVSIADPKTWITWYWLF
jgi:hypothetical protein